MSLPQINSLKADLPAMSLIDIYWGILLFECSFITKVQSQGVRAIKPNYVIKVT